jgi:DNA-binding XRE family transcriptional regulator
MDIFVYIIMEGLSASEKNMDKNIFMCVHMRTMPPSVRRHNLARIRDQLSLTQADLAKLVGCSLPTIKAVETGKLALSDGLASRISQALDFLDKDWLLKNDLNSPCLLSFALALSRKTRTQWY